MPIEYFQDDGLTDQVIAVLSDTHFSEFEPIRAQERKFLCAFMYKTDAEGEAQPTGGDAVVLKKVSAADAIFMDGHYKLYADKTRWDESNAEQQQAMLHRALMQIKVIVDEEKKTVKFGSRKPEIVEYQATIVRFGAWRESLLVFQQNLAAAQTKKATRAKQQQSAKKTPDPEEAVA